MKWLRYEKWYTQISRTQTRHPCNSVTVLSWLKEAVITSISKKFIFKFGVNVSINVLHFQDLTAWSVSAQIFFFFFSLHFLDFVMILYYLQRLTLPLFVFPVFWPWCLAKLMLLFYSAIFPRRINVTTQNLCRLLLKFHKWENNFKSVETYKNPDLPFSVLK